MESSYGHIIDPSGSKQMVARSVSSGSRKNKENSKPREGRHNIATKKSRKMNDIWKYSEDQKHHHTAIRFIKEYMRLVDTHKIEYAPMICV